MFDAQEWVRLIDDEHVTTATVVPTMLDRIVTVLQERRPSAAVAAQSGLRRIEGAVAAGAHGLWSYCRTSASSTPTA